MFLRFLFILILTTLSFSINKTYVLDVAFSGNKTIQDAELKGLLRLKEKTFLSTTEFKSNKLNLDLIALKSFYQSQGYLDVEIDYSYQKVNESNVSINFLISEGKRYKIKEISIIGNKSFDDIYILDLLGSKSEYYNPLYLRTQLISLKNEYLKIGKINISINEEIVKEDDSVKLYIYIYIRGQ